MSKLTDFQTDTRIKPGTAKTKQFRSTFADGHITIWQSTKTAANLDGYRYLADNGTDAAAADAKREVYARTAKSYTAALAEYDEMIAAETVETETVEQTAPVRKSATKKITGRSRAAKLAALDAARDAAVQQLEAAEESMRKFYDALGMLGGESSDELDREMNNLADVTTALESLTGLHIREEKAKGRPAVSAETARLVALNID